MATNRLRKITAAVIAAVLLLLAGSQHQCRAQDQNQAKNFLFEHVTSLRYL